MNNNDVRPLLKKGAKVRVRLAHDWAEGTVVMASENGKSLLIACEHFPFPRASSSFLYPDFRPILVLLWTGSGWRDVVVGDEPWEVEAV